MSVLDRFYGGRVVEDATTLYRKVQGEFVPVAVASEDFCTFPEGCHLVVCDPRKSEARKFNIDPEFAPLVAAGQWCEDVIAKAISKASMKKPTTVPVTQEQADAWMAFQKAMGESIYSIQAPSAMDCAEAGVKQLVVEAQRLMQHESVRRAYDHFMLMCQLVKENETK